MNTCIRAGAATAAAAAWVIGAALLAGCDDSSSTTVPPEVMAASAKPKEKGPKIPTTQELLTGHRSRTLLSPLPLTMELPPGWGKFDENNAGVKLAALNVLQGYTPSGEVQIQLSSRRPMTQEDLDRLMVAAKKEMAAKPQQILKVDLRPHGNVKILERQSVGAPAPYTTYDANNVATTTTESIFNWTISVLVPVEGQYQDYELNFIGLTKSQYDKDKDFLNSILDTIQYGGQTSTTAPAAPPGSPRSGAAASPATLP